MFTVSYASPEGVMGAEHIEGLRAAHDYRRELLALGYTVFSVEPL